MCERSGGASKNRKKQTMYIVVNDQFTTVVRQVIRSLPFPLLLPPLTFSSLFPLFP